MNIYKTPSFVKDVNSLEDTTKKKVLLSIKYLRNFPEVANVKKLKGSSDIWRLRVGDHRVLFKINGDTIHILRVLPRKDAYRL